MKYAIILISTLLFTNCKSPKSVQWPQTAEVQFLSTKDGVINLRCAGYGKNEEECVLKAEQNAFDILFFRGVPGSQQSIPLISTQEKDKEVSKKYFEEFYALKRYKSFITSSIQSSEIQKNNEFKKIWIDVGINLSALRKDLEENNVIGKFGLN